MKKPILFCIACLILQVVVVAQDTASAKTMLETYLENHPKTVRTNFIYEGCNLSVSADSSDLFVQLYIANPMLQMRLLMQECYLFVDPTGQHKEKYAIIMPSAKYVKQFSGGTMPPPTSSDQRPDLSELITLLNLYGTEWDINGRVKQLHSDRFKLVFDKDSEALVYTTLVSREALSKEKNAAEKWSFGFYSPIDGNTPPSNGPMPDRNRQPYSGNADRPQNDDANLRKFLSKTIQQWVSIPIGEIEAVNNIENRPDTLCNMTVSQNSNEIGASFKKEKDTLSVSVFSSSMVTQLDFIMQGFRVDVSNTINDTISILFPSAIGVKDKMLHHPDEIVPSPQGKTADRPDIRYLLSELNDMELTVAGSTDATPLGFTIHVHPDSGKIIYEAQVQTTDFNTDGPVTLTITSNPSETMMQQPEFERTDGDTLTPTNNNVPNIDARKGHSIHETIVVTNAKAQL